MTEIPDISHSETEREMLDVIEDTYRIHDNMCDICAIADGYFGYKILTIITVSFILIVFNLFNVLEIEDIKPGDPQPKNDMSSLIYFFFQICMNCLKIILVAQSSHAISAEVLFISLLFCWMLL